MSVKTPNPLISKRRLSELVEVAETANLTKNNSPLSQTESRFKKIENIIIEPINKKNKKMSYNYNKFNLSLSEFHRKK